MDLPKAIQYTTILLYWDYIITNADLRAFPIRNVTQFWMPVNYCVAIVK